EYPFFEGDGSSSGKWKYYCMAGDDYEGPPIFDDDQFDDDYEGPPVFDDYPYEEEIVSGDVGKGFVDNYPNFQEGKNNVTFPGVVLRLEEESMSVYDTDIEDFTEKEEEFVGKGEYGGEEESILTQLVIPFITLHQLVSEPKFLIKMPPRRTRNINDVYERDDYEGAPVFDDGYESECSIFDDDQLEEGIDAVYGYRYEDVIVERRRKA
ncbi:hypothetical protein Tco_1246731, partial [Tanacetum coccineum]